MKMHENRRYIFSFINVRMHFKKIKHIFEKIRLLYK